MPIFRQIRATLSKLSIGVSTEERLALLDHIVDLLQEQFNANNNRITEVVSNEVLDLTTRLDHLDTTLNALKALVTERHNMTANKLHALSNYVMGLEEKLNEIVELLTSERSE